MAPCGGNIVTPKMIRKGEIHIGDRIHFEEASAPTVPASAVPEAPAPAETSAIPTQAESAVEVQGTFTDESGVTRRQTAAHQQVRQMAQQPQQMAQQPQQMAQQPRQMAQQPEFPLNFNGMTDYVNSMTAAGGQSPSFNVPSHPMVPPEYEQTIDYDSIQYMNGFLRTQIGRYVRVEQLIGSGNTEERFGFLVGVGNNYLLLQDISDGNILVVDFYSIKFVYIYFGEPVFPNIPLGPAV